MKYNARFEALQFLIQLTENKTTLSAFFSKTKVHTPLTRALCYGVSRQFFRLEAIADCLVSKRPKEKQVWLLILLGLYQLRFMQQPAYAVVQETVALLKPMKHLWAKGLVNAVLRNACRQEQEINARLNKDEAYLYAHPPWVLEALKSAWPKDWLSIVEANNTHPPMVLRVNVLKDSVDNYIQRLKEAGIASSPHLVALQGIVLDEAVNVEDLPGFREGDVSVQDGAAQLAAHLLDLKPNLRVLDACCAPGGKTCHILETEPKLQACIALDLDDKRLLRVEENLKRLQLQASVLQGDALKPETWWDGMLFDRILLDAPCSATGVIRRHPDIKLLRTKEEVNYIIQVQQQLLATLWPLLAPGGRMVYATCSILPEENAMQLERFVESTPDCKVIEVPSSWGIVSGPGIQILPGQDTMDGFYYGVLEKCTQS